MKKENFLIKLYKVKDSEQQELILGDQDLILLTKNLLNGLSKEDIELLGIETEYLFEDENIEEFMYVLINHFSYNIEKIEVLSSNKSIIAE